MPGGVERQPFVREVRGRQRRDLGHVVGRRDLDDVHAHEVDAGQPLHDRERLGRREPAGHRRPGPGRERGVQAIDVEREVGLVPTDDAPYFGRHRLRALLVHPRRIEHVEAHQVVVVRTQPDLHRCLGVDEAFARRVIEHRPVIDAAGALGVVPGVRVGVEVDQRQRAVLSRVGLQQRVAEEVITPQRQHRRARREDCVGVRLDRRRDAFRPAVIPGAVAIVDHRQPVERIERPSIGSRPGDLGGRRPDRPRTEARSGPVGRRRIERDAGDGDIDARKLPRVAAPEKAQRTGKGRLRPGSLELLGRKRVVVPEPAHRRHPAKLPIVCLISFPGSRAAARLRTRRPRRRSRD